MADIQFEEEQEFSRPIAAPSQPTSVRLALATGLVKTEKQAEYMLIGTSLVILVVAFFVWYVSSPSFSGGINPQNPAQVQLMRIQGQTTPNVYP